MPPMDGWDIALFTATGYIAVISLVKLMRRHHERRQNDLRAQIEHEKRRLKAARRKKENRTPPARAA